IRAEQLRDRLHPGRWPRELKQLASEFDQMLIRLEDSFARLKQLSDELAHELRTPVQAMMGQTELALTKPRSASDYRSLLESNLEEQERLARLIDNLLFLARADNAQTALMYTSFDLAAQIDALVVLFDAIAKENDVTLTREGVATLYADRALVDRAMSNLISNAIRHTRRGGTIRLVTLENADGSKRIEVIDNGTGIAPEHLPHVFERFYRGEDAKQPHD